MAHRFLVAVLVDVRRQQRRVKAEVAMQKASQIGIRRIDRGQQFHAIAGGDDHALADAGHGSQCTRRLRQILA